MSAYEGLAALTRGAFVLLFVLTLVDFGRRRDLTRLEIALLFASIGVSVVLQTVTKLTGIEIPYATTIAHFLPEQFRVGWNGPAH
ncbi:MAG: hypothetical protein ACYDAG_01685 [Chloroflexota bacterium]